MSFWSDDIRSGEIRSPRDILREAADELSIETGLAVALPISMLADRHVIGFETTRKDIGLTVRLFEVSHRPKEPYPAVIIPPDWEVPEFLRRKKFVPGQTNPFSLSGANAAISLMRDFQETPGKFVENEWVCSTPAEFCKKLTDLLHEDRIKVRVISLVAHSAPAEQPDKTGETETEGDQSES